MTTRPHYWFPVPPSGDRPIKWWFPFVDDSGRLVWDFPVNIGVGGGGGGDLPALPDGFAFVVQDGVYVVDGNGDFVIVEK